MLAAIHRRIWILLLLIVAAGTMELCWAHAVLVHSAPKLNSAVKGPEVKIDLRFSSRIDGNRSSVRLVTPDGATSKLALARQPSPDALQAHVTGLKPGAYKLEWQVLASDGHMTRGEIPFKVN